MSRIWTKDISPDITVRISACWYEESAAFKIEKITLVSESGNNRIELSLFESDINGLILLIKEAKKGIVKFK